MGLANVTSTAVDANKRIKMAVVIANALFILHSTDSPELIATAY